MSSFHARLGLIADRIKYKNWRLITGIDGGRVYIQWEFKSPDWASDDWKTLHTWKSRKWHLSEHMIEEEIVQTALAAAITAEEHEAREAFSYRDVRLFHPHIPLEVQMKAAQCVRSRPTL